MTTRSLIHRVLSPIRSERLNLGPGQRLYALVRNHSIVFVPVVSPEDLEGRFPGIDTHVEREGDNVVGSSGWLIGNALDEFSGTMAEEDARLVVEAVEDSERIDDRVRDAYSGAADAMLAEVGDLVGTQVSPDE